MAKGDINICSGSIAAGSDLACTPAAGVSVVVVSGGTESGVADMAVWCNYGVGQNYIMVAVEGFQDAKILIANPFVLYLTNNNVGVQSMGMAGVQLS